MNAGTLSSLGEEKADGDSLRCSIKSPQQSRAAMYCLSLSPEQVFWNMPLGKKTDISKISPLAHLLFLCLDYSLLPGISSNISLCSVLCLMNPLNFTLGPHRLPTLTQFCFQDRGYGWAGLRTRVRLQLLSFRLGVELE